MIWLASLLFLIPFALIPFLGAPYVPSKSRTLVPFLKKIGAKPAQTLLDLGSGDATVMLHVARELQMNVVGVELNPFLVVFSRIRLLRFRSRSRVIYGNIWTRKIPEGTDIIYAFIMPKYMARLEEKVTREISVPTIVVTYSFEFNGRKPFAQSKGFLAYNFEPLAKK